MEFIFKVEAKDADYRAGLNRHPILRMLLELGELIGVKLETKGHFFLGDEDYNEWHTPSGMLPECDPNDDDNVSATITVDGVELALKLHQQLSNYIDENLKHWQKQNEQTPIVYLECVMLDRLGSSKLWIEDWKKVADPLGFCDYADLFADPLLVQYHYAACRRIEFYSCPDNVDADRRFIETFRQFEAK